MCSSAFICVQNNWRRDISKAVVFPWDIFFEVGYLVSSRWEVMKLASQKFDVPGLVPPTQRRKGKRDTVVGVTVGRVARREGIDRDVK